MDTLLNAINPPVDEQPGDFYAEAEFYDKRYSLLHCGICGTRKQTVVLFPSRSGRRVPRVANCICQHEGAELDRRDAARKSDLERRIWEQNHRKAFGTRAARRTFADDDGKSQQLMSTARAYCANFAEMQEAGSGLLFFGAPGQGKTFAAECIANDLLAEGRKVRMLSVPELIHKAQSSGFDKQSWLQPLVECDLLILDDLGAERVSAWTRSVLFALVDARYSARKPFVVTSNLSATELQASEDAEAQRIYDRLLEVCLPIEADAGRTRYTKEGYQSMKEKMEV